MLCQLARWTYSPWGSMTARLNVNIPNASLLVRFWQVLVVSILCHEYPLDSQRSAIIIIW
jgi:hypothetical protein